MIGLLDEIFPNQLTNNICLGILSVVWPPSRKGCRWSSLSGASYLHNKKDGGAIPEWERELVKESKTK